jgi:hypothetical protein
MTEKKTQIAEISLQKMQEYDLKSVYWNSKTEKKSNLSQCSNSKLS